MGELCYVVDNYIMSKSVILYAKYVDIFIRWRSILHDDQRINHIIIINKDKQIKGII